VRTVEVELEFETRWQIAAEGGNSSFPLPKDATISYQASRVHPQRRPPIGFEPRIVFGAKVETIKIFFVQK
jgi:hypothetical protein